MMKPSSLLLSIQLLFAGSLSGQYCLNVGPSSTIDSNVETVQLSGVVGAINYTGCPGVVGLQDLTASSSVTLNAGANYSVTIKWGTCGGIFSGAGTAWIDYNSNYIFETSEIIATWQGSPPFTGTYPFTVPSGAQNGVTRMRIIQQEGTTLPLNPCATFTWGSATDFSVTIGNGIDCTGYVGDDTTDPIIVSSLPYSGTGDNSYCYSNQNLVYASPDVYYRVNPSPLMESISVTLCGSGFDTFLSVVETDGNVVAFNDDAEGCGTSSALTFNTEGLGQVYVIVEGWGSEMGEYEILINVNYLSLSESEDVFGIHPNPAGDLLKYKGLAGNLQVTSITGSKLVELVTEGLEEIDLSGLSEGVYFLHLEKDGERFSKKFMIQR